jgi:hypothetical protein
VGILSSSWCARLRGAAPGRRGHVQGQPHARGPRSQQRFRCEHLQSWPRRTPERAHNTVHTSEQANGMCIRSSFPRGVALLSCVRPPLLDARNSPRGTYAAVNSRRPASPCHGRHAPPPPCTGASFTQAAMASPTSSAFIPRLPEAPRCSTLGRAGLLLRLRRKPPPRPRR